MGPPIKYPQVDPYRPPPIPYVETHMIDGPEDNGVPTFCALCVSRCGARATVDNGRLVSLEPDPSHPTGRALCIKGKSAPELVHHPDRLLHPLKRTRAKTDPDPGWRRISWDEALNLAARRLREIADTWGPETVVFSSASPSTSAMSDSVHWVQRLRRAFGSPNLTASMELCGWGRYFASTYTFGAGVPGVYMPDLEHAGCILYWGYNPSVARLAHATATVEALGRGARLVVVDPRRVGFARRADQWLRVRPGTDGALALSLAHVMIDRGWFDLEFVGRWTNGPFLVRSDTGRFLRESDLVPSGSESRYVLWDDASDRPVFGGSGGPREPSNPRLFGEVEVSGVAEGFRCRPAFHLLADLCRQHAPERAEKVTGVPAEQIRETARLLWEARPMAFYAWSGVEQHTNTTQTVRAIGQLQALTGSFDARGGNVLFPSVPTNPIDGLDLIPAQRRRRALGLDTHPLGPPRWEFVSSDAFYTAALEGHPYRARGLVGFGANLLLAQADGRRGREALAALDFYMHADLFMNPTAHMADVVLPVTSPFESEGLQVGFEINPEAQSLVQLRKPLVDPRGEARSDIRIVFELATRLGLGHHFWQGDIDAAWSHQLEPSGLTLDTLRERPEGVRLPLEARYWKFAEDDGRGPRGFSTPTGRIELYSETFLEHGYSPLPEFREPALSPHARPDLGRRFPLVLTSSKSLWYCESQQRALPGLRRRAPDPAVDLHPDAARSRGIAAGDWVRIETPNGSVRARARFDANLAPDVVCGQHGWWQACPELGEPGFDPFSGEGANLNLVIRHRPGDPVSASVPHRSYLCQVARVDGA